MKAKINKIISTYTEAFRFLSVNQYQRAHQALFQGEYAFLMPYKTIIVLGFPYPKEEVKWLGKGYGLLARFSYSNDYHTVIMNMIKEIEKKLQNLGLKVEGRVDVNHINEKFAASLSGLGYYGKNHIIIHPTMGNYVYLATLLIDFEIPSDSPLSLDCGSCTKCIDACPSSALSDGFHQDRCISHLSQTKKTFDLEELSYFKTMIYGCDICLKVCPKNDSIDIHKHPLFEPNGIENVDLKELLNMSNKDFQMKFGQNTSHWIGAATMKRNALALIMNQKCTDLIPDIRKSMDVYKDNLWYNKTAEIVIKELERE
jgi:epoxyqueuosine reductase